MSYITEKTSEKLTETIAEVKGNVLKHLNNTAKSEQKSMANWGKKLADLPIDFPAIKITLAI